MRRMLFFVFFCLPLQLAADSDKVVNAVMRLTGVTDPENIDTYDMERLADYMENPFHVNKASAADMQKCGLFTPYQAVSLADYIARHGDVLSYTELAAIDGFGADAAEALSPFISLDSYRLAGQRRVLRPAVRQDLSMRGGIRSDAADAYMYGVRYRFKHDCFTASLSASRPYAGKNPGPESVSGNISWNHRRGSVLIGDFNARFGQGLCLWNTSVIGGYSSPSAFMRKPSGLSSSYSFTGNYAMTGIASDFTAGRWKFSTLLSLPGIKGGWIRPEAAAIMPAVNISRYGRYGHVSFTHLMEFSDFLGKNYRIPQMNTSADASVCIKGVNLFGEVVYNWVDMTVEGLVGSDFRASDDLRIAALLMSADQYLAALGGEIRKSVFAGNFSVEAFFLPSSKSRYEDDRYQVKARADCEFQITESLCLKIRLDENFKTYGERFRTGARMEMICLFGQFNAQVRFDVVKCRGYGFLGYVECGCLRSRLNLYLRAGIYRIDSWDDRIYVYERDAPGSFNVPAYYGRGFWTAIYFSWKPFSWCRLYLRASYGQKPGRAELKVQSVFRL